jgi:hypothetical protein
LGKGQGIAMEVSFIDKNNVCTGKNPPKQKTDILTKLCWECGRHGGKNYCCAMDRISKQT